MNLGKIFGATFLSCLVAFALYDMVVKGLIGGVLGNKYDNTNFQGKNPNPVNGNKKINREAERAKRLQNLIEGREGFDVAA